MERTNSDARHAAIHGNDACATTQDQCLARRFNEAISRTVIDFVPLCHKYARKAAAIKERLTSDACHAVGNRNTCKAAAAIECTSLDARHAVGDDDACKAAAIRERRTSDARHAVGDGHSGDPIPTCKCSAADLRNGIAVKFGGNDDMGVGMRSDARQRIGSAVKRKLQERLRAARRGLCVGIGSAAAGADAVNIVVIQSRDLRICRITAVAARLVRVPPRLRAGRRLPRVIGKFVSQRGDGALRDDDLAADGAMTAFGEPVLRTGGRDGFVSDFRMDVRLVGLVRAARRILIARRKPDRASNRKQQTHHRNNTFFSHGSLRNIFMITGISYKKSMRKSTNMHI